MENDFVDQVILALDYGEKKIGMALKAKGSLLVKPIGNFKNQGDVLLKVTQLCKQYHVDLIIIGYPLSGNLKKNRMTFLVEKFTKVLYQSVPKKMRIKLINERFTTSLAKSEFFLKHRFASDQSWQRSKDSLSALHILNRYLDCEITKEKK